MARTIRNTTKAITRKLIRATITKPAGHSLMAATFAALRAGASREVITKLTMASTTLPKAPPMTTATASPTTLPWLMNALKSEKKEERRAMGIRRRISNQFPSHSGSC